MKPRVAPVEKPRLDYPDGLHRGMSGNPYANSDDPIPNMKRRSTRDNIESAFRTVAASFRRDEDVILESGRGFGSGTLKVKGRIFAMISSGGHFVVKLPEARVRELTQSKRGKNFELGRTKKMREWFATDKNPETWQSLAAEARKFVAGADA